MFEYQLVAQRALLQTVKQPLLWVTVIFFLILAVTAVLVHRQLRSERARSAEASGGSEENPEVPDADEAE